MNDPLSPQLPKNSELSFPTTQQNGDNSRLSLADLHCLIETAIGRYWSRGVKIKTQKDLINLEKVIQVVNDSLTNQSTSLDAQNQTYFEILQGLYQEFTGNFSAALNYYQAAIAGSQQIEDNNQEKWILIQTAHCYFLQAYWEKELGHPAWQNTRHYLSQSLQFLAADNWQNLRDDSLTLIGKILRGLEDWEQLKAVAESFLNLYYQAEKGEHQDPKNLGLSLPQNEKNILSSRLIEAQGFLGECFIEQWQFEEAKIAIQRALNLYHQSPDGLKHFHSWLHYLLGRVQMGLKGDEQAINLLESAKESIIFEADPQLYLAILIELRYCYCKRQDAIEALAIDQLYQALEYRMGKRSFIGINALSNVSLLKLIHPLIPYSLFTENERDSGVIPTEISHSERIQDLQTIQSLISDRQTRILIVYGDRGIGKTSLIQSGLIPNLDSTQNFPILIQDLTNWQFIFKQQLHLFFSNHGIANDDVKSVRLSNQELFKDHQILFNQLQQLEKQSIQVVVIIDSLEDCFNLQLSNYLDRTFWQFLGECFSQTNLQVIFCTTPDYVTPLLNHFSAEFKQNAVLKKITFYQLHPFSEEQAWQVIQALSHKTNFPLPPDLIAAIIRDLRDRTVPFRDHAVPLRDRDHQINCRELQILGTVLEDQKIKSLKQYQIQGKDKFIEYYIETILKNCSANDQKIASICLYLLSQFNQSLTLKNLSEINGPAASSGVLQLFF
jgi:type II secretory pathway predicted ATPase ExeA